MDDTVSGEGEIAGMEAADGVTSTVLTAATVAPPTRAAIADNA
jgi:hypothetical protein